MRKRILALILYLTYGLVLTYALSFGRPTANLIYTSIQSKLDVWLHDVEIEDVEMSLSSEEVYPVGKSYAPKYTVIGDVKSDAGLVFTSLDDTVVVGATGSFRGVRTDDVQTTGRIRITSKYDPDFEKIVTLQFEKKYPSEFSLQWFSKSVGYNSVKAYVGIPLYLYTSIPSDVIYSEKDYTVEYDSTYFELVNGNCLMPIRETPRGETVTLRYVYGNGDYRETAELRIYPTPVVERFDEIYFGKEKADGAALTVKKGQTVYLYKDGKRVYSDYTITADASAGMTISSKVPSVSFNKPGTHAVTVTLPNGYSQTVTVHVQNKMAYPTFVGMSPDVPIELTALDKYTFSYTFPKDVTYKTLTYEYDKELLTVRHNSREIYLTGKRAGETTLKIVLDDGVQRLEEVYSIVITDEHVFWTMLRENISDVVTKGLGHMGGFFGLAFFSLNLFRALALRRRLLRWGGYVCSGLFFALLTEFIQFFMPKRDCSLADVGVDMFGFLLGTLVAMGCTVAVVKLVGRIRKKRGDKAAKNETLCADSPENRTPISENLE